MNYFGLTGILISIILLIYLTFKGFPPILSSLICSFVVFITNSINPLEGLIVTYSSGAAAFMGQSLILFLVGALYGKIMLDTGITTSISYKLMTLFGEKNAPLITLFSAVLLNYIGVSAFIMVFALYPIAVSLFNKANLPKRILAASFAVGSTTFSYALLPGNASPFNALVSDTFGTSLTAAPLFGLFGAVLMCGASILYINRESKKARLSNEGFVAAPTDTIIDIEAAVKNAPSFIMACLPILALLISLFLTKGKMNAIASTILSVSIAILIMLVVFGKRLENPLKTITQGLQDAMNPLLAICFILGFAQSIQSTTTYQQLIESILSLNVSPMVMVLLISSIVAAITTNSLVVVNFVAPLLPRFLEMGVNPEILQRIIGAATIAPGMLPHSASLFATFTIAGLSFKEGYKDIFITCVLIPAIVTLILTGVAIVI